MPRLPVYLSLVLAAMIAGGCSGAGAAGQAGQEPVAPSFEPIHFAKTGHGGGADRQERRTPAEDAAGWQEKWDLASRYAAGGYDEAALQVLDAALAVGPPAPWGKRLRDLRSSLVVRRAEETLLRVEARGVKDYVAFGQDVDFVLRLRNVSPEVVTLLAPPTEGARASPSAFVLTITRRDRDVHATRLTRRWTRTVFLLQPGAPPIHIPPGGTYDFPVRIPAESAGGPLAGLRTLEVGGTFRPTRLRRGAKRRQVRLPIRPGRVVALPGGFEPLAADPLGSMRRAIDAVAPEHLLVATEFVRADRRAAAVTLLAEALGRGHPVLYRAALGGLDLLRARAAGQPLAPLVAPLMRELDRSPERAEAIMEGLGTVSGAHVAPDPRLWREWWRRESGRHAAVPATEDA
jgi:hypothetical protein